MAALAAPDVLKVLDLAKARVLDLAKARVLGLAKAWPLALARDALTATKQANARNAQAKVAQHAIKPENAVPALQKAVKQWLKALANQPSAPIVGTPDFARSALAKVVHHVIKLENAARALNLRAKLHSALVLALALLQAK